MKKLLILSFALFAVAPSVHAQNSIGIGWDNGYSIRFPAAPVTIQLTGRFDSAIPEDDDLDTETDAEIAAYVAFPFMEYSESKLNVFGGFGILPTSRSITVGGGSYDKELDYTFRLGIEPVVMVTDHIGLSGKAGLQILMDQGYNGIDDTGSTDLGAWGSIGVHWHF